MQFVGLLRMAQTSEYPKTPLSVSTLVSASKSIWALQPPVPIYSHLDRQWQRHLGALVDTLVTGTHSLSPAPAYLIHIMAPSVPISAHLMHTQASTTTVGVLVFSPLQNVVSSTKKKCSPSKKQSLQSVLPSKSVLPKVFSDQKVFSPKCSPPKKCSPKKCSPLQCVLSLVFFPFSP